MTKIFSSVKAIIRLRSKVKIALLLQLRYFFIVPTSGSTPAPVKTHTHTCRNQIIHTRPMSSSESHGETRSGMRLFYSTPAVVLCLFNSKQGFCSILAMCAVFQRKIHWNYSLVKFAHPLELLANRVFVWDVVKRDGLNAKFRPPTLLYRLSEFL